MHREYFEAGVDAVETATFGAFGLVLAEYGIADVSLEMNVNAARIAKEVAAEFATPDRPRFVIGSIGPGTRLPSLGAITFAALRDDYQVQAAGLIEGGADVLLVETVYDLLQAKSAIVACRRAMSDAGRTVPLMVQVTMETTGRMLVGSEIGAAVTALEAMKPDVIGLNCATGPAEMTEHLRYLKEHARTFLSCLPNAGLPSVVDGHTHYDLTPDGLADAHERFVREFGINIVGGCCGTTPEHLRAVVDRTRAEPGTRRARARLRARLLEHLLATSRTTRSSRTSRSASAPTPTGRASSATRCSKATGTPACRWPASRSRRARTSSTSASTTSGATAPSTWRRSRRGSPPRPRSRWCSTPPSPGSWKPGCSTPAARRSSTRPTSRTAKPRAHASTA